MKLTIILKRSFFKLTETSSEDYYLASDYINRSDVDIVCLQHEFGLFGGDAGDYIFTLCQE